VKAKNIVTWHGLLMILFTTIIISGVNLPKPTAQRSDNHTNDLSSLRMALFLPSLAASEEAGTSCNVSTTCSNDSVLTCSATCTSEQGLAWCEGDISGMACGCGEDINTTECP